MTPSNVKKEMLIKTETQDSFLFPAIFLIIALLLPHIVSPYYQHIIIMVAFYAFTAVAWNFVCGFVGSLSLGHSLYMGLGGYISSLLLMNLGLSPWIGMFIGAAVASLVGVLVGAPTFRLQGPYFTLTSIALCELVRIWVENNETLFGIDIKGSMGLVLPQSGNHPLAFEFASKKTYYYIILAFLIVAIAVTYTMTRRKLGFYLVAIKSDPDAAESLGISLTKYKLIAMAISTFMMSIAGTFYAQYFRYIGPTRIFGHDLSVQIALIALVGGQGSVFGPVIGSIILVPLTELLSERFGGRLPGLHLFIYGVVMMLVVMFMPNGIYSYLLRFKDWLKAKITKPGISAE